MEAEKKNMGFYYCPKCWVTARDDEWTRANLKERTVCRNPEHGGMVQMKLHE